MKITFDIFYSISLDLDLFYSIRFNKGEIRLQGHYNSTLVEKLQRDGYIFTIDECGNCIGKKYFNEDSMEDTVQVKIIMT
jgi:hypothetical protein